MISSEGRKSRSSSFQWWGSPVRSARLRTLPVCRPAKRPEAKFIFARRKLPASLHDPLAYDPFESGCSDLRVAPSEARHTRTEPSCMSHIAFAVFSGDWLRGLHDTAIIIVFSLRV